MTEGTATNYLAHQRVIIGCLVLSLLAGCEPAALAETVEGTSFFAFDGFRRRGAVAIAEQYAITDAVVSQHGKAVNMRTAAGEAFLGAVRRRDSELGLVVIDVCDRHFTVPRLADSGLVTPGDELVAAALDTDAKTVMRTGKVTAWRPHSGRAYIETDLNLTESGIGTGVFASTGELVGVYAFTLDDELNYVLPIEYVTARNSAVAAKLVEHKTSDAFVAHHKEAEPHQEPLETPFGPKTFTYESSFSQTALVAEITMLDPLEEPVRTQSIQYKLDAVVGKDETKTVVEGTLDPQHMRWVSDTDKRIEIAQTLQATFGQSYVERKLAPYDYGRLRFRLPLVQLCEHVLPDYRHRLILTFADDRSPDPIDYDYMTGVCAGREEGWGDEWEQEWGLAPSREEKAVLLRSRKSVKKPQRKPKKSKKRRGKGRKKGKKRRRR